MLNSKTRSRKVENLLGFYELLETRIGKSLEKTLDTTTISYQNLNLSIDDTREIMVSMKLRIAMQNKR